MSVKSVFAVAEATQDPFTRGQLRELLASLLDGWARDRAAGPGFESRMHPAAVGTVYALAAHAHRLGCAVAKLFDAELDVEAIPLIRTAYEATITAAWIGSIPDALPAYLNTNQHQQQTFRSTVRKAGWSPANDVIAAEVLEPHLVSESSAAGAAKIWQLCRDFTKGDELYSLYRALCWITHPTAIVTDLYLELKPGAEFPTLHTTPQVDESFTASWLFVLCSSLVWSARALNLIDHKRSQSGDRTRLRQAAKRLNIDEYLEVKADAKVRGQKSEQRRTRRTSSTGERPDTATIRPDGDGNR